MLTRKNDTDENNACQAKTTSRGQTSATPTRIAHGARKARKERSSLTRVPFCTAVSYSTDSALHKSCWHEGLSIKYQYTGEATNNKQRLSQKLLSFLQHHET